MGKSPEQSYVAGRFGVCDKAVTRNGNWGLISLHNPSERYFDDTSGNASRRVTILEQAPGKARQNR
jgi:hypothetical protein